MGLRKLLLRVMLVSLGTAAVIGALAMLLFNHEIVWRIVGTTIATAVAAGLMMSMAMLADRERCHTAGVVGMGAVVAEFLLCLVLMWGMDYFGWQQEERLLATIVWVACTALPAMFFLRLGESPTGWFGGRVGVAACALALLVGAGGMWVMSGWREWERLMGTGAIVGTFGALAALALIGAGRGDRRYWRYAGVGAALVAGIIAIAAIWFDLEGGSGTFAVIVSFAVFVPLANVLLLVPVKPEQRWLVTATIAAAAVAAVFTDVTIVFDGVNAVEEMSARVAGAAGILGACGALALGVLARLNRKMGHVPVLSAIRELTLICPGCDVKQTVPVGEAACLRCGLLIHTRIEEPRCSQCDYLLYMLKSDKCPECGTRVRTRPLPTAA